MNKTKTENKIRLSKKEVDAVIFDMDGVITQSAKVHARAWKEMFDDFLKRRAARLNESHKPFDIKQDYKTHVDGLPRYDGVKRFLESRKIDLPFGSPSDRPDQETVCGLGNRKNALFQMHLNQDGVNVYKTTIRFIRNLRAAGVKTAVVSSSKNCAAILEQAGVMDLFDTQVGGIRTEQEKLKGKPEPDIFLKAARDLGVEPQRAVVVEDALAGVEAGVKGRFGCVIGVNRGGSADAFKARGAHVVVSDLQEIEFKRGGET